MRFVRVMGFCLWLQVSPALRAWFMFTVVAFAPVLLIGVLGRGDGASRDDMIIGYAVMVVVNAALSQVAAAVAADRTYSFDGWLRSFPCPALPRVAGKGLGVYLTSLASVVPLILYSLMVGDVSKTVPWHILGVTVLATVVFGLIGALIGLLARPDSITYLTNFAFIVLVVVGGLFTGGRRVPFVPEELHAWLPSTPPFEVVTRPSAAAILRLITMIVILGIGVWLASRRQRLSSDG